MNIPVEQMKAAYDKHKNLKVAADELGMKWQTLYWYLKKYNHPVVGDKSKYGTSKDKLASLSEAHFANLIPEATNMNQARYQSKWDFELYGLKIDIKASTIHYAGKNARQQRYCFSVKKQEKYADFIVAFGYSGDVIKKCFLFPQEIISNMTTVNISEYKSKWSDYEIPLEDLRPFFERYRPCDARQ
ncbi:MAG: hypothetical protein ACFNT5_01940 [Cardiobacterium hominis]|jgi:hypothetical protein